LSNDGSDLRVYQNGCPNWDLLCFVRYKAACFDAHSLPEMEGGGGGGSKGQGSDGGNGGRAGRGEGERQRRRRRILEGSPCAPLLEARAFDYLRDRCEAKLAKFPTTAAQDEDILQSSKGRAQISPELELAVTWRLSQKRVLMKAIDVCERYREYLSSHSNGWE